MAESRSTTAVGQATGSSLGAAVSLLYPHLFGLPASLTCCIKTSSNCACILDLSSQNLCCSCAHALYKSIKLGRSR
jgi:hypothetical protein